MTICHSEYFGSFAEQTLHEFWVISYAQLGYQAHHRHLAQDNLVDLNEGGSWLGCFVHS
jgi:hypothetical protein